MEKEKLRMKEYKKYEIIKELVDHKGNKNRASLQLGITVRQVNRLIKIYKEKGKSSFVHGNRGHIPTKALDKSISEDIILLYNNKYYDFNFCHFREFLKKEENITVSYKFIYTVLNNSGILSPRARRKTKKEFKKKQLLKEKQFENKTDSEIETIVNHEVALENSHPRKEKPKNFGELIEMDGSIHNWFGQSKSCLHLAVDRATNTIVGGYFDSQETLNGYYHLLNNILIDYGIPYKFLTDNRTVFNYMSLNPDKRTSEKDVLTQFGYACKQLGIALETTSVPEAKGLIERDNGTFQGRLVQEFRLYNIYTIEKANKYLNEVFIPNFNKRFALNYENFPTVFESSPSSDKINYTLAILTERTIDNGNAIKFKNKYYQPYENERIKCFVSKTKCLVIESFNHDLFVTIDDQIFELKELIRNAKYSVEFEEVPIIKERKKYIPPMSHPFKLKSFQTQMRKSHNEYKYA